MAWWRATTDGLIVFVRLTPRGGRDAIDGPKQLSDGNEVLAVRARAVPEDGAANAALLSLIAKSFGVAKSAVTLAAGATARVKQVKVVGEPAGLSTTAEGLAQRLK